jgi:hypothetical protein
MGSGFLLEKYSKSVLRPFVKGNIEKQFTYQLCANLRLAFNLLFLNDFIIGKVLWRSAIDFEIDLMAHLLSQKGQRAKRF